MLSRIRKLMFRHNSLCIFEDNFGVAIYCAQRMDFRMVCDIVANDNRGGTVNCGNLLPGEWVTQILSGLPIALTLYSRIQYSALALKTSVLPVAILCKQSV